MNDIVIVGGGHVGLFAASELAKKGYRTLLLDQKKAIGERIVCTGIIGLEAFEKFDLPENVIVGQIQNVKFFSPSGRCFDYFSPKNLAYVVDRPQFNKHFASQAKKHGARILVGYRVTDIEVQDESVTINTLLETGERETFESRFLILATGVNYRLFGSLGIELPKIFLGGSQIHVPFESDDFTSIYVGNEVAPGAFAWIVPLQTGLARVGLLSEKNAALFLRKFLTRIMPESFRYEDHEIELKPVMQLPIDRSYAHRTLIIGEAAGQIKTTTGGGIYYGLLGAEMAVEKVMDAFDKSRFSADVLSAYDRKWKRAIGDELNLGYYFRKLFAKLKDEQIEELFKQMIDEEVLNYVHRHVKFDWHKNLLLSIFNFSTIRNLFLRSILKF